MLYFFLVYPRSLHDFTYLFLFYLNQMILLLVHYLTICYFAGSFAYDNQTNFPSILRVFVGDNGNLEIILSQCVSILISLLWLSFSYIHFPLLITSHYVSYFFCLTLQVLQSRSSPAFVPWKGGAVSIFPMMRLHFYSFLLFWREGRVSFGIVPMWWSFSWFPC